MCFECMYVYFFGTPYSLKCLTDFDMRGVIWVTVIDLAPKWKGIFLDYIGTSLIHLLINMHDNVQQEHFFFLFLLFFLITYSFSLHLDTYFLQSGFMFYQQLSYMGYIKSKNMAYFSFQISGKWHYKVFVFNCSR